MAHVLMPVCSYGLHWYGLCSSDLYSCGYKLMTYTVTADTVVAYIVMAYIVMAPALANQLAALLTETALSFLFAERFLFIFAAHGGMAANVG